MEKQLVSMSIFINDFSKGQNELEHSLLTKGIGNDALEKKLVNDVILIPVPVVTSNSLANALKNIYSYFWSITQCIPTGKSSLRNVMLVYGKYSLYANQINKDLIDQMFDIFNI